MMESLVLGVLFPLSETRESYEGLEVRIRKLPSLLPLTMMDPLLSPHMHIYPCFAACPSMC